MTLEFLYWFFLLLVLIFGGFCGLGAPPGAARYGTWGWGLVTFLIFVIIGLKLFGGPIKG